MFAYVTSIIFYSMLNMASAIDDLDAHAGA